MEDNRPFVHLEYLPVADNTAVTGDSSAITQAGKLVALDDSGKINRYFIPYNELSVTSLSVSDGEKITGDVRLYGSGIISVNRSGNNFYIGAVFPPGVTGVTVGQYTLTGGLSFLPGNGLSIQSDPITNSITFTNEGVISLNGLTEDITLESTNGVSISTPDSSTIVLDISGVKWSQFDSSSPATAAKVISDEGIFFNSDTFASVYSFDNKLIIRGEEGVLIPDPVTMDSLTLTGGNGLFIGDSRVQEVSGSLYLAPSSGAIVFPSGTALLGVEAIEPGFSDSVELTWLQTGAIVSHTFSHSKGLFPTSVMVTREEVVSGVTWETTQGFGVDLTSDYGYNISFNNSAVLLQARLNTTGTRRFNVRIVFASDKTAAALPAPISVTSAPLEPFVSFFGVPDGGGFAVDDLVLSTRPVLNAASYKWDRVDSTGTSLYTWYTTTPLLSTLTTPEAYIPFRITKPGVFRHTVRGVGEDSLTGPAVEFDITIRPKAPLLSVLFLNVQDDTSYPFKTADIVLYHQTGFIRIIDEFTGLELNVQTPISYVEPASSLNNTEPIYPELVEQQVTLTGLLPNTSYRLKAQAYLDSEIYSDFSSTLDITIPPNV